MAEPDGKAITGRPEGNIKVELVHDPQPHAKPPVRGAVRSGDEACQAVDGAVTGVMDRHHDMVRRGPDAYGHRRAAVDLCIGDGLGDADQQVLGDGAADAAADTIAICPWLWSSLASTSTSLVPISAVEAWSTNI